MTLTIDQNMFVAGGLLLLLAWLLSHRCPDCPLAAARPVAAGRTAEGERERGHEGSERAFEPRVVDKRAGVAGVDA